jgi:hypothetical protein
MAAASILALSVPACYLPLTSVEPASPAIVGEYQWANGAPAAGARIAVTSDSHDVTCAKANGRGTTDATGMFQLGRTTVTRRGVWLVPALEHFGNPYYLCVGPADTTLRMVYSGAVNFYNSAVHADTLTCLAWIWQDVARTTCAGRKEPALQSGGTWIQGSAVGFFRLIITGDGRYDRTTGVFLQWVQHAEVGTPEVVRETIALPLAPRFVLLDDAKLWARTDRPTCVSVRSSGKGPHLFNWDLDHVSVALELGAPGETHRVSDCSALPDST